MLWLAWVSTKPAGKKEETVMMHHPILIHFEYEHLAEPYRETASEYEVLARKIDQSLRSTAEKSVALRKLLESRDAAIRGVHLDLLEDAELRSRREVEDILYPHKPYSEN